MTKVFALTSTVAMAALLTACSGMSIPECQADKLDECGRNTAYTEERTVPAGVYVAPEPAPVVYEAPVVVEPEPEPVMIPAKPEPIKETAEPMFVKKQVK